MSQNRMRPQVECDFVTFSPRRGYCGPKSPHEVSFVFISYFKMRFKSVLTVSDILLQKQRVGFHNVMNVIRGHSNHNIFPLMHCALTHFVSARFSPQLPSNPSGDDRYLDLPDQLLKTVSDLSLGVSLRSDLV